MSAPKKAVEPGTYWEVVPGTKRKHKPSERAQEAAETAGVNTTSQATSNNRFAPLSDAEDSDDDGDYTDSENNSEGSSSTDPSVVEVEDDEQVQSLGAKVASMLRRQVSPVPASREAKKKAKDSSRSKNGKAKRKRRKTAGPTAEPAPVQSGSAPGAQAASTGAVQAPAAQDPKTLRQVGLIWRFYSETPLNKHGVAGPAGSKHWKCAHCAHIGTMTKGMKGNINTFVDHLQKKHTRHHQLYLVMKARGTAPTVDELQMARGAADITPSIQQQLRAAMQAVTGPVEQALERQAQLSQEPFEQAELERLLLNWIIARNQPFEEPESPEFRELLNYVHHRATPLKFPSADTVRRRVIKMGENWQEELTEILARHKGKFSLALDAWTSPNYYPFLAIVLYYVNDDWELEEILLDFRELVGEHSGENLAAAVWGTLTTYGLRGRILAIASDNASNNDTLMTELKTLSATAGHEFNPLHARIRCTPHIIHLAACKLLESLGLRKKDKKDDAPYQESVTAPLDKDLDDCAEGQQELDVSEEDQALLKELEALAIAIPKLRAIIRAIRSSPQRRQAWVKEVDVQNALQKLEDRAKMLILDVSTRWSSTHQMLRRALHYRNVIQDFVGKTRELRQYELSDVDWHGIKIVCDWLKAFRDATTQMSTTHKPMLSSVYAIYTGLQDDLRENMSALPPDTPMKLLDALAASHNVLAGYFYKTNSSPYYVWAALLDPRIAADLEGSLDDESVRTHIRSCMASLRDYYTKNYVPSAEETPRASQTAPALGSSPKRDFTARYKRTSTVDPAAELDEFFGMRRPDFASTDPLQWWRNHARQFPHLSNLARDILAIPGSAVAVERIFSSGRDVLTIRRSSLKPETITVLMLLKHKLRCERDRHKRAAEAIIL